MKRKPIDVDEEREPGVAEKCWETFFRCQPNPIIRSQLLTALLAGSTIQVDRVPTVALQDVLMLALGARKYCDAEIVDSWQNLKERVFDVWARPDFTHRMMDQTHCLWCSAVVHRGAEEFLNSEERYVPAMVAWYLGHASPSYFVKEIEAVSSMKVKFPTKEERQKESELTHEVIARLAKKAGTAGLPKVKKVKR
jgi:hypothetical protein